MSVWTTPITWVNGSVTAAQMNSLRDNLNFVKGALDVLTGSTSADTGSTMGLFVKRTNTVDVAYATAVPADTFARLAISANGDLAWGSGGAAADITLKRDTVGSARIDGRLNLYNTAASITLALTQSGDANLRFAQLASGEQRWGDGTSAFDTNLYRLSANMLGSDDGLTLVGGLVFSGTAGITLGGNIIEILERAAPGAGGVNTGRIFCQDNGAGKTQLMVIFNTGAAQQIAIQP